MLLFHLLFYKKNGFFKKKEILAPSEEELTKEREKLWELISNFDLEDVFNCDETGNNLYLVKIN
jgi:hypothetical protein